MSNRRVAGLLIFAAGAAVGVAWPRIRNFLKSRSKGIREKVTSLRAPKAPKVTGEEERILTCIRPQGIAASEIALTLGTLPGKVAAPLRKLLEEGRIKKEENLYFPA